MQHEAMRKRSSLMHLWQAISWMVMPIIAMFSDSKNVAKLDKPSENAQAILKENMSPPELPPSKDRVKATKFNIDIFKPTREPGVYEAKLTPDPNPDPDPEFARILESEVMTRDTLAIQEVLRRSNIIGKPEETQEE